MVMAYVIFAENVIALLCQIFSMIIFTWLLYKFYTNSQSASPAMWLYVITTQLFAACGILLCVYCVFWFNGENTVYNFRLFFWFGVPSYCLMSTMSLAIVLLGFERCAAVLWPGKMINWRSNPLVFAGLGLILVINVLLQFFLGLFDEIPDESIPIETDCLAYGCLLTKSDALTYMNFRLAISALNIVIVVFLRLKIRSQSTFFKHKTNTDKQKKNHALVMFTVITTIIFDFVPCFVMLFAYLVFQILLSRHIGPISMTTSSLDAACNAFVYFKVFRTTLSKKVGLSVPDRRTTLTSPL